MFFKVTFPKTKDQFWTVSSAILEFMYCDEKSGKIITIENMKANDEINNALYFFLINKYRKTVVIKKTLA